MKNPFIENNFLCLNVSINRLFIAKMPEHTGVDQDLEGKTAIEIFSTKLFIDEIKKYAGDLKLNLNDIEEKMLPQYLNNLLESVDSEIKKNAEKIVKKFGERLGIILLTLKLGEKENRIKREDWNDDNWEYWKSIKNVILAGGLASSNIGERLKYYVEKVFKAREIEPYNIILNKDSGNVGIIGASTYIQNPDPHEKYLIFDLGHSFIKRSIVQFENKKIKSIEKLDKVLSRYVRWEYDSIEDEKKEAYKLNDYILNAVLDAINQCKDNIGSIIVMSIANYVRDGVLADRGGYKKLRITAYNYEEYLSDEIYEKIQKRFRIKLVHDGTAMAAAFSDYPDCVCLALGTAFGVGFPIKSVD